MGASWWSLPRSTRSRGRAVAELGIVLVVVVAGWAVVAATGPRDPFVAALWSAPVGVAVHTFTSLGTMAVSGALRPGVALGLTAAVGVAMGVPAVRRSPYWGRSLFGVLVVTIVVVFVARRFHLTRFTPDSFRYLLMAADLQDPSWPAAQVPGEWWSDLLKRGFGLPAVHALADLTDRRYLASVGPVVGVALAGWFARFCWVTTEGLARRRRLVLVAASVAFLGSSNRLVYDVSYLNTHLLVATWLFLAVSGAWLAATRRDPTWAVPAGLALAATVLMRAEAALVIALVLVPLAGSGADRRTRLAMAVPSLAVGATWFGVVATYRPDPAAWPPFTLTGSALALTAAVVLVVATDGEEGRRWGRWAATAMVPVMLGGLAVLTLRDPTILSESLSISFDNLVRGDGRWALTWVALALLLPVATAVSSFAEQSLWTRPVWGYLVLFWLLPYLRDEPWTPGTGDSGVRILAHVVVVAVALLVLAAVPGHRPGLGVGQEQLPGR
jgi:hypothetical protein